MYVSNRHPMYIMKCPNYIVQSQSPYNRISTSIIRISRTLGKKPKSCTIFYSNAHLIIITLRCCCAAFIATILKVQGIGGSLLFLYPPKRSRVNGGEFSLERTFS